MKLALYALTSNAYGLALNIKDKIPEAKIFAKSEISCSDEHKMNAKLKEVIGSNFNNFDCHLFIMATGIVVRLIAPMLKHKSQDPAVLVADEKGMFIISLLSGHLGGANDYCNHIAKLINSQPVITTASDVQGTLAVDTLSMKVNGVLTDFNRATNITALIVEDKEIGIISDFKIDFDLPKRFSVINKAEGKDGYIYISNMPIDEMKEPYAYIRLPRIVLGIGCRRGKSKDELLKAVTEVLDSLEIPVKCIKNIGTVDVKADEVGLIELVNQLEVPLTICKRQDIKKIEDQFEGSDFVMSQIGVKAVSEPVGYITSKKGKKLTGKIKKDGITISVWEENHE